MFGRTCTGLKTRPDRPRGLWARAPKRHRSGFGALGAWLAGACLLLALAAPGMAQTTYVSNIDNTTSFGITLTATLRALPFTTGGTATDTFPLGAVDVRFESTGPSASISVEMWSTTGSGANIVPDAQLYSLTASASTSATTSDIIISFAAPENTVLDGATSYAVVITDIYNNTTIARTANHNEPVAETGWSIANYYRISINNGTTWTASSTSPFLIAVKGTGTTTNNPPTASDNTVTTNEDTAYTFTAGDFGFMDDDAGDTLASVSITTLESAGDLELDGTDVTLNQVITKADIDSGDLTFTPAANANGSAYATFGFKVNDGTVDSTDAYTMTIDVTAVNDPPTASQKTVTINEDTAYTFAASDFNFADVDGDTLASVKIISLETAGHLELDGIDVTINQVISKADIDAGDLTFTPGANEHNSGGYASFRFTVNDGTADSAVGYSMNFNVTAVNDAPTVANAIPDQSATVDTAFSFQFAANAFADVDDSTLTYAAELDGGGNLPSWLTFTAGTRTFSGTPAAADAGTVSVKVTASDDDSASVSDTFVITVSAGASSDATLSALGLEDGDGNAITLNPTFSSSTTDYTAWVGNGVDSVTLSATSSDAAATVAITDDDDTSTPATAELDLDVGANTLEVTVTATDNSTQTYTVVVTRNELITVGYDPVAYRVSENGGSVTLTVKVTSHASGAPRAFIVRLQTANGTAVSPGDYGGVTNQLIQFNQGDTSQTHTITVIDDTDLEDDETFQATLSLFSGDDVTVSPATATVTIEGRDASGKPEITGLPQVGETLTAGIGDMADGDNLPGSFPGDYDFQWVRVDANGTSSPMDIGTNSDEYTPVAADVGKKIRVRASFTDGGGAEEQLTSDATADAVVAAAGACPANNDWCAEMTVGSTTVGATTYYGYDTGRLANYGSLDDDTIDYGDDYNAVEISNGERTGGGSEYFVYFDAFVPRGSKFDIGGTELTANASSETTTPGSYLWEVSTEPGWIEDQKVTVSANLAPIVTGAEVTGDQLVLTFAEDLDANSKPAAGAFTVYIDGDTTGVNPSSVDAISGKTVTMTLATAVTSGQTVTLDYTAPGTNPLQDESGLDAPGFTGQAVTNRTGTTSSDATLSDLDLFWDDSGTKTAIPLSPPFTSASTSYTATVGSAVDEITIEHEENDSAAGSVILDGNDTTLTDADGNTTGFQVELDEGENTIKVKVTAEDNSTQTYTVVVTRNEAITVGFNAVAINVFENLGNMVFTVEVTSHATGAPRAFTLLLDTADGTAESPEDYGGHSNVQIPFAVGDVSKTLTTAIVNDSILEGDETFQATLSLHSGSDATISRPTVTVRIEGRDATGKPAITGTPQVGETLTATIGDMADDDTLPGSFPGDYDLQWVRVDADGTSNPTDIGTNSDEYTLVAADVGKKILIRASFTDGGGAEERLSSDAYPSSGTVTTVDNSVATGAPAITGVARQGMTLEASTDGISDADGKTRAENGDAGYAYTYQWFRVDDDGTSNKAAITGATSRNYVLTAGEVGSKVIVEASFTDDAGNPEGPLPSAAYPSSGTVISNDTTAPSAASATVNGDSLIIYFDEDLAAAPNLANSAFTVMKTPLSGSEESVGLSGAPSISGAQVTLTLAAAVDSTDGDVKVSYARPSSGSGNRLEDAAGNEVASFTDLAVSNNTPAPGEESAVSTWYVYFDRTEYTATEGGAGARVTVRLNAPWKPERNEALTVILSTTELEGGASEADYSGVPDSVTFQPGQTAVSFTVRATNDNHDDDGESIRFGINTRGYHDARTGTTRLGVDASGPPAEELEDLKTGQGPSAVTVHLKDNSGPRPVTVSFGEPAYTATEGGADATVEVRLSERPGRQVIVPLTRSHSNVASTDYNGVPESVTFGSNQTVRTFDVEAVDDSDDDDLGSVTLGFGDLPAGVSNGSPSETVVNIADNDGGAVKLTLRFDASNTRSRQVREGLGYSLGLSLDKAPGADVRIPLEVEYTGGATADDITGVPASLTIERGKRKANVIIRGVDDAETDPGEGFKVTFGALPPGVEADERYSVANFTIIDNDIPEINVSDASANEPAPSRTVWLRFKVTLSRSFEERVRVNYATADGTARAGEDYEAASGTLEFPKGDTEEFVRVKVLDDDHDEGTETLTLVLSNPVNATLGDNTAEGRINNTDPMPGAWLTRFGRAASDASIDAIGRRMDDDPASHLTLGGGGLNRLRSFTGALREDPPDPADPDAPPGELPSWERMDGLGGEAGETDPAGGGQAGDSSKRVAAAGGPGPRRREGATRSGLEGFARLLGVPDLRALLMGSSFFYSPGERGAGPAWLGSWSAWGETSAQQFRGAEGGLNLNGELATATLGFDTRRGRWLAGLALSYTDGRGGYARRGAGGEVASSLTSLNPYLRYELNERTDVWGVIGYGVGELSLTPDRAGEALEAGLSNAMAALGGRTALAVRTGDAGRFELALRSDARFTRTASGAVEGLVGAGGSTGRVRMLLEGSGKLNLASGGVLKPTLKAGLRYDGGDAETGAGLEVGAGLGYTAGRFKVRVDGRVLLAHEDADYKEWGFSGSVAYTPGPDGRGLHFKLGSSWGDARGNVDALWSRETARGLAQESGMHAAQQFTADVGYSLPGRNGHALWTPYVGARVAGAGRQRLRVGVKLSSGPRAKAELEIGQQANVRGETGYALTLGGSLKF